MSNPVKKNAPEEIASPPNIVSAVGVAVHSITGDDALAKRVEEAMSQAVTDCLAQGVSIEDSEVIKAAMLVARARVRAEAGLEPD
jgi:hypothetical protein